MLEKKNTDHCLNSYNELINKEFIDNKSDVVINLDDFIQDDQSFSLDKFKQSLNMTNLKNSRTRSGVRSLQSWQN
ncbi:hypothetical protein SAMD00019534_049380 [Acytostelium subglobosum LB1]|uniref:hypothetical protein n=1 Tax=Acytostelium subglobosum LB1 TaxID=1410327 RepID=UPI000644D7E6|nr:hypothetical protein SAMD00019534_049380 [Acytostelium subglobosum LB1]GAM21763.1 hypothetical protein SAMD00019534_049380 [Acytostelium subglobosum LB1]|eukprot:XP_012754863.1 hypothetical protein SAMD00019534_049380 [Acytostelium subglobosum LB1]